MRIIAGEFRGRRLAAPQGMKTRPTTDRVREAWFSMLGPLSGRVADLYAGTGALGFEALSRGASRAVFVESWNGACRVIRQNSANLELDERVRLLSMPVERCAQSLRAEGPYDLVLTDPPWTSLDREALVLIRLLHADLLTPAGRMVVGHPRDRPIELPAASGLLVDKRRSWGDSAATFYVRAPAEVSV